MEGIAVGKGDAVYAYCITGEEPLFLELGSGGDTYVCPIKPLEVYDGYGTGICLRSGEGMFSYEPESGKTGRLWDWEDEYIQADGSMLEKMYAEEGRFMLLYCRPPGFTVVSLGKHLAGGLQSGCTANLTGAQYISGIVRLSGNS